jgi:hypothetical protein
MARKSSRAASPIAPVRDLFTASERRLLETSFGTGLARASHATLETATRQARILRDKWRGLSAKQGRATKRAAGATSAANARSKEKAGAFGDAVARLERRLAELVASSGVTVGGKPSNARAKARDKTIAGRAARRTTPRPEKPAVVAPAPRPIARPVAPPAAPAAPRAAVAPAPAPAKPKRVKTVERTISKKARVGRKAIAGIAPAQSLRLDQAGQRSAGAAAKAGRFAVQGATTHRKAHLAATGKRNQARRDGRKR